MIAIYNNIKMYITDYIMFIIFSISTKTRIRRPNTEGHPLGKLPKKSQTNKQPEAMLRSICCYFNQGSIRSILEIIYNILNNYSL